MSRFKVGQKVFMGRGEKLQELTVKRIIDNPLLPIYQYAFEEVDFRCGEQSIRAEIDGLDLKLSECFKDNHEEQSDASINTLTNGLGKSIYTNNEFGVNLSSNLFFKPDLIFVKWLKEYAGDRMIVDVGSGQGHLVRMLKMVGAKVIGIEPNFDYVSFMELRATEGRSDESVNEILPMKVQEAKGIIQGMGSKAILIFARPSHNGFVEDGLDIMPEGMEALYITIPENLERYCDLGKYENSAVLIEHKGISEDSEIVFSIKK